MSVSCVEIVEYCQQTLKPDAFRDYCPNGLQVEGTRRIHRMTAAVTASLAAIEHARDTHADLLLVHHGILWDRGNTRLIGYHKQRVAMLLAHGIHLLAYHLPLDAHPTMGNNAQLAQLLGINMQPTQRQTDIVAFGTLADALSLQELMQNMVNLCGDQVRVYGNCRTKLRNFAWCTGAGGDFFERAISQKNDFIIDAYITGEVSERHFHLAHECKTPIFALGHHASERYGVQALARNLVTHFNEQVHDNNVGHALTWDFFDEPNPI